MLAECIGTFPESTVAVLIDNIETRSNSLKTNPLFIALADKAQIISFPILKNIKLSQWIQARVTKQGGSISRQATDLLMQIIGGDLFTLVNEINKLVAFTSGRLIEEKDVRMVVSAAQEADVFALVDAIMDRKTGLAEQILQKLLQRGTVPSQILALLARQIQIMLQLKDLKNLKRSNSDIQSKLGIYNPYTWNKVSARAEKYVEKLRNNRSLLATDLESRQVSLMAIWLLISLAELSQLSERSG
jgi:DNA polymerase-3 subunit delta